MRTTEENDNIKEIKKNQQRRSKLQWKMNKEVLENTNIVGKFWKCVENEPKTP